MTVPTFGEVHRIESAAEMRDLIRRGDLPDDPHWWSAVISVGQSALVGAESGRVDADEWASVLVESLDVAALRTLGVGETVFRRMIACIAAMHYFGECTGDPVRDPELVFRHFTASLGGSPEVYFQRYRDTFASALRENKRVRAGEGGDLRAVSAARSWLDGTRGALTQMCRELASRLAEEPRAGGLERTGEEPGVSLRDEAALWCALLPQIEGVRSAERVPQGTQ